MRTGLVLISVGLIFLLKNLGLLNNINFSIVWPTLLILAGLATIMKPAYKCVVCNKEKIRHGECKNCRPAKHEEEIHGRKIA